MPACNDGTHAVRARAHVCARPPGRAAVRMVRARARHHGPTLAPVAALADESRGEALPQVLYIFGLYSYGLHSYGRYSSGLEVVVKPFRRSHIYVRPARRLLPL